MPYPVEKLALAIILVALVVISFLILKPFIAAILMAVVLAYILMPLRKALNKKIKSPGIASGIILIITIIITAILIWFTLQTMLKESIDLYTKFQTYDYIAPLKASISKLAGIDSSQISLFFDKGVEKGAAFATNAFSQFLSSVPSLILQIFVMFFVLFFFLRDGDSILNSLRELLPFRERVKRHLFKRFEDITWALIYGVFAVGIVQGLVAGLGYILFGAADQAVLLTSLSVLFGMIPFVGSWIIWAPLGISMIATGATTNGIALLVYGWVIVSHVDNIVRPYFISKKARISQVVVLLGIFGGFEVFGIVGVFIGPLVLDYALMVLEIYRKRKIHNLV